MALSPDTVTRSSFGTLSIEVGKLTEEFETSVKQLNWLTARQKAAEICRVGSLNGSSTSSRERFTINLRANLIRTAMRCRLSRDS